MRSFLITVVLALVLAGVAAWALDLWKPTVSDPTGSIFDRFSERESSTTGAKSQASEFKPGERLYDPKEVAPAANQTALPKPSLTPDAVIVPGCRLTIRQKQLVSPKHDGILLFVGKMVDKNAANGMGEAHTIGIDLGTEKELTIHYQPWEKLQFVKPGEMIAMLDPAMAMTALAKMDLKIHEAKIMYESAIKKVEEAKIQYDVGLHLHRTKSIALEELRLKKLTLELQESDMKAKEVGIKVAQEEKREAQIILNNHTIRNGMAGVSIIKDIFRHRKEPVKSMEPIMELYNIENLRAEGMIDHSYLKQIEDLTVKKAPRVSIEPVYDQAPFHVLPGHRAEVTSVAFSNHADKSYIISASRDGTVRVWLLYQRTAQWILDLETPVEVVACSPAQSPLNLFLTGCDDGTVSLWDMNELRHGERAVSDKTRKWSSNDYHRSGGVTALAFSPDGRFFATGGEDRNIVIWEIISEEEDGAAKFKEVKKKYVFNAEHGVTNPHEGTITSLSFTPAAQLVSVSRDKTLRVWDLYDNGAQPALTISGRGGAVNQLGVSADGRYMLFEQGRRLQLLSVADGNMMSELSSPTAATSFETLALFAPDSSLMLTAGAADGRLQLWKTPEDGGRGIELRQWVPKDNAPVTCAAFAPGAGSDKHSFAASGSKSGNVYLWRIPTTKEAAEHTIHGLQLDMVDRSLGAGNQVRIGVNVRNQIDERHPYGTLKPGATVTVVIEP